MNIIVFKEGESEVPVGKQDTSYPKWILPYKDEILFLKHHYLFSKIKVTDSYRNATLK